MLVASLASATARASDEDRTDAPPTDSSASDARTAPDGATPGGLLGDVSGVEVIQIKGRRVGAIETEIPASVTQFDSSALEVIGAQNVADLARVTPNLEIKATAATSPTFFIRGVGLSDFNANATGAVAIYQDGVPLNAPALQLGQLFDVESLVVLRGPQPWGDERNASAGMISITSRRPDGELGANLRADYGNFDYRDFEGAISTPILGETLSSRLSFRLTERDPFVRNRCAGAPPPPFTANQFSCGERNSINFPSRVPPGLADEVNDDQRWAARGIFRLQPSGSDMDWLLNLHGAQLDQLSTLGQVYGTNPVFGSGSTVTGFRDPAISALVDQKTQELQAAGVSNPGRVARDIVGRRLARDIDLADPYDNAYNMVGPEKQSSYGGSLRGEMPFGPVELTTISGGETYSRKRDTDFDFSPNTSIHSFLKDDAWQASQSLRLGGELVEAPLRWRAGGYFLREKLTSQTRFLFNFNTTIDQDLLQDYTQDTWSAAGYANFAWDFLDDFTLEGGVRYNWERKHFLLMLERRSAQIATLNIQPGEDVGIWTAPTGGLSLTYHINDDVSVYWKYSRGWKSGHFNAAILRNQRVGENQFAPAITSAEPETLDTFEAGFRGTWLDGRLALGAALFYYNYSNYQVFLLQSRGGSPPQFEILNANDARLYGAEVDLRAEPLADLIPYPFDGIVVSGSFGWLESQFLDFTSQRTLSVDGVDVNAVTDFSGNSLPNAPQFKVSAAVEYNLDFGSFGTLIPRYDFSYTSDVYFDPSEGRGPADFLTGAPAFPEYAIGQPAFWLHNARLTWRSPETRIEIAGWVRNFTDQRYKRYVADAAFGFASVLNFVGDPRTYGGSISFTY